MAQRKQLTWSELRVGLFVLVGLLILAVGIFYVTGAGVFGPKYRIKTYLPEVSGLSTGAPVRLDGVDVGTVDQIHLVQREPGKPPDHMHNIEVVMRIDRNYKNDILTDSAASLVTEGLARQSLRHHHARLHRRAPQGRPSCPRHRRKSHQGSCRAQRRCTLQLKSLSDDVKDTR